jgi:hypothetical protein
MLNRSVLFALLLKIALFIIKFHTVTTIMGGDYGGQGDFPPTFEVGDIVSYILPTFR